MSHEENLKHKINRSRFLMMRFKFGSDRRNDWRCCFCCHVRTGTIFLGIWHLILHILALSVIVIILRNPEVLIDYEEVDGNDDNSVVNHKSGMAPALPTPLSSEVGPNGIEVFKGDGAHLDVDYTALKRLIIGSMDTLTEQPEAKSDKDAFVECYGDPPKKDGTYAASSSAFRDIFGTRPITNHDLNTGVVVTFCTFLITLLMVYGACRNKPSYLMPFFCLQVFDFCIACLTAVGYLCYLPDVRRLVSESRHIPFQSQLQQLNAQCLSMLLMLAFVGTMTLKAYFIGVVWRCYKYLSLRRVAQMRMVPFIEEPTEAYRQVFAPDSPMSHQEALLLLPDYETAVNDPRYALNSKGEKKSLGLDSLVMMAPPPAYSSVVQENNQVVPEETVEAPPEGAAAATSASDERTVPATPAASPTHEVPADPKDPKTAT